MSHVRLLSLGRSIGVFAALCAAAALPGCMAVGLATERETRTFDLADHGAGAGLIVETSNGAVRIARSESANVRIVADLRMTTLERLEATEIITERLPDGALRVAVDWPEGDRRGNEGCNFTINVPDVAGVTVKTSNGAVHLTDLSGAATAKTSNGVITIENHRGPVDVRTSNGRVMVTKAEGPVKARTSNGAIIVHLLPQTPGPVDLVTSNGPVTLGIGTGFKGELSVSTSNGGVTFEGPQTFRILSTRRTSMRVQAGEGGEASTIRTSNGRVRIVDAEEGAL